jgi:hypothetical protein
MSHKSDAHTWPPRQQAAVAAIAAAPATSDSTLIPLSQSQQKHSTVNIHTLQVAEHTGHKPTLDHNVDIDLVWPRHVGASFDANVDRNCV